MFNAKLNAQDFKTIITATTKLLDEVNLVTDEDGMSIKSMDASHVALIDIFIPMTECEFYLSNKHIIPLDLEVLKKIVGRIDKDNKTVELELIDETYLVVKIDNKTFELTIYNVSESPLNMPKIEYINEFQIEAEKLLDSIKDNELVSSHVIFEYDDLSLTIKAKGEIVKSSVNLGDSSEMIEKCKVNFAISYIKDIITCLPKDNMLTINVENDKPLTIKTEIGDVTFSYFIAPRIE